MRRFLDLDLDLVLVLAFVLAGASLAFAQGEQTGTLRGRLTSSDGLGNTSTLTVT